MLDDRDWSLAGRLGLGEGLVLSEAARVLEGARSGVGAVVEVFRTGILPWLFRDRFPALLVGEFEAGWAAAGIFADRGLFPWGCFLFG